MGQTISFKRPDGKTLSGYLAQPTFGPEGPGIVVIQEWWGLNDQIRGVADHLASLGYRALGVDYENDGFVYDVVQHGPVLGMVFRF